MASERTIIRFSLIVGLGHSSWVSAGRKEKYQVEYSNGFNGNLYQDEHAPLGEFRVIRCVDRYTILIFSASVLTSNIPIINYICWVPDAGRDLQHHHGGCVLELTSVSSLSTTKRESTEFQNINHVNPYVAMSSSGLCLHTHEATTCLMFLFPLLVVSPLSLCLITRRADISKVYMGFEDCST